MNEQNINQQNLNAFIDKFREFVMKNHIVTIRNFIKSITNSIQGDLISKCYNNNINSDFTDNVLHSLILDINVNYDTDDDVNIKKEVAKTPIISCVWNYERLFEALSNINIYNNNPFDSNKHSEYIDGYLIQPLGLVIVTAGCHSVNSAIIHNEGYIPIYKVIDISPALETYEFNGNEYVNRTTGERISHYLLKNSSEPFTYTLGLLFEMARVLMDSHINIDEPNP